ncbi:MAG: zinc ribbon domain-containing protein [Octadecabacter sp.]|nr:zinc ribbon domain-containing protein [Octadecabacter sp.]
MAKRCESCGIPLSKDPEHGGTEADGTRSDRYCSMCYADGAFLQDAPDGKTFQRETLKAMRRDGFSLPMAWLLTRGIPNLPRWQKT